MKLPYFKLYVSEFIANTSHLTDAQVGKIVRALCKNALNYPRHSLPDACKIPYERLEERQQEDFAKYRVRIDTNQEIARTRRAPQDPPDVPPNPPPDIDQTPSTRAGFNSELRTHKIISGDKSPSIINARGRARKSKIVSTPEFENFKRAYPRNPGSWAKACELYAKIIENGEDHAKLERVAGAYARWVARTGTEPKHTKHATTWLNGRFWDTDYDSLDIGGKSKQSDPPKSGWISEGERLAEKYRQQAIAAGELPPDGQNATQHGVEPDMRDATPVRQDAGGIGNAGGGFLLGASGYPHG